MTDKRSDMITSLFPRAELLNEPQAVDFMNSLPQTFSEAEKLLSLNKRYLNNNVMLENRIRLTGFIRKFHSEADTLRENVKDQCSSLGDPEAKLVVSTHQPNLFAYGGVFKKVVLLETLKNTIEKYNKEKIVNLFLVVDHDFIDEVWMRRAQLPSFHHSSGLLQLRFHVNPSKKWHMVCNIPPPRETTLYNWKRQIVSWIKKSSSSRSQQSKMVDNLNQFWEEVEISYSKAKSYSDFNSFLMSRVINNLWGYNTLFVRLSEISEVFKDGFEFLISNLTTYTDVLRRTEQSFLSQGIHTGVSSISYKKAPIWLHCKCGGKAPVSLIAQPELAFNGLCISCKNELFLDLAVGGSNNLDLRKVVRYISPRAIAIPLLLSRDLGISCYCSGQGGLGYLMDASIISKHLGITWPLTLVWASKDVYPGVAQDHAMSVIRMDTLEAERRLQELDSINNQYARKIYGLIVKRKELMNANRSPHIVLDALFQLKEEQRRIRREIETITKATKMLNLSPCMIDYAVNFGMVDTEKQWSRHLLEDGDLTAPVHFNPYSRGEEVKIPRLPN